MAKRYRLEVELLEDLHSGTGTGAGAIDAVQIRDRAGRPVIRSSHVKGLWRAAGVELAELGTASHQEVVRLFGGKGMRQPGALVVRSLRTTAAGPPRMVTWTTTARREFDRAPRDDSLRSIEYVGAGTCFVSEL